MKLDLILIEKLTSVLVHGATKNELIETLQANAAGGKSIKTLERILKILRYDYNLDIVYHSKKYTLYPNSDFMKLVKGNLFLQYQKIAGELTAVLESVDFGPLAEDLDASILQEIISAIKSGNEIRIYYHSYACEKSKRYRVASRSIKFWNHRWYLIALKLPEKEFRTFEIGRILRIQQTEYYFKQADYPAVPKHIIGVTNYNLPPTDVEIAINEYGGKMFESISYHPSQKVIRLTKNSYHVKWEVAINKELIEMLVGLHHEYKIIRPTSLKKEILNHVRRIQKSV